MTDNDKARLRNWYDEKVRPNISKRLGKILYMEYDGDDHRCYFIRDAIELWFDHRFENLKDHTIYDIKELCGEEEECES